MNLVKIPYEYTKIKFSKEILNLESDFLLESETIIQIDSIDSFNINLVKYIVYRILKENKLSVDIELKPTNGIEFINKLDKSKGLGIYHAHLNNQMVLIWYIEYRDYDYYLKLEYIKHPHSYKDILKSIYKNSYSYDVYNENFLKDIIHNTEFNESKYILNFKSFIKKFL